MSVSFLSKNFDPELALAADTVQVPFPDVVPLNNIAACRRLLPASSIAHVSSEDDVMQRAGHHHNAVSSLSREAVSGGDAAEPASAPSPAQQERRPRLSALFQQSVVETPLWKLRRRHVRVIVHRRGVLRGIITGRLELHDRHLNIVLRDAHERFIPVDGAVSSSAPSQASASSTEALSTWCWRHRSIALLLIRGETVVSVCATKPGSELDLPATSEARTAFRQRAVVWDPSGELPCDM